MKRAKKHVLDYAFYPGSIAVVGASNQPFSGGYHYLNHLVKSGFPGQIYPVNPNKESLLGLQCYPSVASIPGDIDFVICCVSTDRVLTMLEECSQKNVRVVHLFTARLGETGRKDAIDLEQEIRETAERLSIGLIGPNCMGIYCPESRISFAYDLPVESGDIGVVFQSGGAASLLVQYGGMLGLRFSKAVSYGNALLIDESDIINYLADDAKTSLITAYFEGVRDGNKFVSALKYASSKKPIVAIKGGRGHSGTRAVISHTAALAGSEELWTTVFDQCGVIQVKDLDEMLNLLILFNAMPPLTGNRLGIAGGGGGKCVLAADLAEDAGFTVPALSPDIRKQLKEMVPSLWDWLGNPVDFSIWGDEAAKMPEVRRVLAESPDFDCMILQMSDDNPLDDDWWTAIITMDADSIIDIHRRGSKPVIAILNDVHAEGCGPINGRWKILSDVRNRLISERVPTFNTAASAIGALAIFVRYWRRRQQLSAIV